MKFLLSDIEETDRHTEIDRCDISDSGIIHEEMTVRIKLIGSCDTRNFTTEQILSIIADRLKEIEPK